MDRIEASQDRAQSAQSLREPGALVLISCYELGHQPNGLAFPMGVLEEAGYAPQGLDVSIEDFDVSKIQLARFIGISVPMHTALRLGLRVAELVRQKSPSCHICFYGLYASLNEEYLLHHVADSVIGGEFESPLLQLVQALDSDTLGPLRARSIQGVSRQAGYVAPVLKKPSLLFPKPARSALVDLEKYAKLEYAGQEFLVGNVETSRGCLHTCLHCPIVPVYEGRFFIFSQDVVLQDIRQQVEAGAQHVTFGDPDFLNGPTHSLNILRQAHHKFPELTFDFTTKIEHILRHQSVFTEFAQLRCLFVISAVESFSNVVLTQLHKGHTREDIIQALNIVDAAGMTLRPSFVSFTPWTTLDDYLEMLEIIGTLGLIETIDPVQLSVRLLVPPGSALLRSIHTGADPITRYIRELDRVNFQYPWSHPDPRMDELHRNVSNVVERAVCTPQDSYDTFFKIADVAYKIAGRTSNLNSIKVKSKNSIKQVPRLTESWFCCAEPTKGQLNFLDNSSSC